MSFSAGLWRAGYDPLQDVSFAVGPQAPYPLEVREARFAYRLVKRKEDEHDIGEWVPDYDSFGDVLGGFLWHESSRSIPAWAFAWPARAHVEGGGGGGTVTEPAQHDHEVSGDLTYSDVRALPIYKREPAGPGVVAPKWKGQWTVDNRLESLGPTFPEHWPKIPGDFHGIVINATREDLQTPLWMHTDPRSVSVNVAGDVRCGSFVVDLDPSSKVDPLRMARLQSHERVIKEPTEAFGCPPIFPVDPETGKKANSIAWVITKSGKGDVTGALVMGRGCAAGRPPPGSDIPTGGLGFVCGPLMPPVLALASCEHSGPLDVGSIKDIHEVGYDADGTRINSLHISTCAYFRMTDGRDAPLDFSPKVYQPPNPLPQLTRVHLRYDEDAGHGHLCGSKKGKWKWLAETQWGVVTPGDGIVTPSVLTPSLVSPTLEGPPFLSPFGANPPIIAPPCGPPCGPPDGPPVTPPGGPGIQGGPGIIYQSGET